MMSLCLEAPKIKDYLQANLKGNVSAVRNGGTLDTQTVVLYNGSVIDSGFVIAQTEKGHRCEGRPLPGRGKTFMPRHFDG